MIDSKKKLLEECNIALWDVCYIVQRASSLDKDILEPAPNDLKSFLKTHKTIKKIGFNGKKAKKIYDKFFPQPFIGIEIIELPSTSPANAGIPYNIKLESWKQII